RAGVRHLRAMGGGEQTRREERLPEGYFLEAGEGNHLVLRRADGSAVGVFALTALGPTPESIRLAAEEDYRVMERRGREEGEREGPS
ncbi:MAG: hypothetical protein AB1425_02770, partial [Actinomycetota bacterium]